VRAYEMDKWMDAQSRNATGKSMKDLFTDGLDIVIADSAEDATFVWQMEIGSLRMPETDAPWVKVAPTRLIKLVFSAWGNLPDVTNIQIPDRAYVEQIHGNEFHVNATAAAWADANKKCILSHRD
jgi:hypothetical protein